MHPARFQVSRRHKDPIDSKRVCRPSRWGNGFKVDEMPGQTKEQKHFEAVQRFRSWMNSNDPKAMELKEQLPELKGKNLGCFCPLHLACHADVLLEMANPRN